jgi:ubiquinone/menaquinone biosynthesis C-methylase UbiE
MAFYQERVIPWLIHLSMRQRMLSPYRDRVVSGARGRVLEVGIGSGLNLPFYASTATEIIGLDPSPKLLEMAHEAARKTPIRLRLIEGTAEAIPIEDHHVDAVVTTWTMCSIPEIQRALQEMRRVLRPGRLFLSSMGARWSRECAGGRIILPQPFLGRPAGRISNESSAR